MSLIHWCAYLPLFPLLHYLSMYKTLVLVYHNILFCQSSPTSCSRETKAANFTSLLAVRWRSNKSDPVKVWYTFVALCSSLLFFFLYKKMPSTCSLNGKQMNIEFLVKITSTLFDFSLLCLIGLHYHTNREKRNDKSNHIG